MTSTLHFLHVVWTVLLGASGSWSTFLFGVILKGTILLLFALMLALALRRASAASRHLVWTLGLGAVLALPVLSLTLPVWKVPILSASASADGGRRITIREDFASGTQQPRVVQVAPERKVIPFALATPSGPDWLGWVLSLWVLGSILFVVRMAAGEMRIRTLVRLSELFETNASISILENVSRRLRIHRTVELRASDEIGMPFTRGVFRSVVFLPAEAGEWSSKHLELVLAHELAHVYRHDCLTQVPAQIACAFLWFHPLVWLAAFQMRKERERACDDIVLSLGHRATDYAEFLLLLGRGLRRLRTAWSTSVAMAQTSQLEVRMKALLDPRMNHKPLSASRALFVAVLTFALLVPAAAIRATTKDATGNISGTLHDPSGAVVPGAGVILISSKIQTRIASRTDEDGTFSFPEVPSGRYRLEFAKPGFARTLTGEFDLGPSSDLHQNFTLNLGWVSEELIVRGHRPAGAAAVQRRPPQRIRVGGLVQAARLVKIVKPAYPGNAEKQGTEGTVILRAVIGTDGRILSLEPYNGADPDLIKAATDAVRQWRYQPTLLNGVPVEVATTITVVFRLDQ